MLTALLVSGAFSAPASLQSRQEGITDLDVLQFALTLEHLENVFYKSALQKFSEADFLAAGVSAATFEQMLFVAHDEEAHVQFLQKSISDAGGQPVEACEYNFPFTDVPSFVSLASVLEGVGVSAYLGGAPVISSKDILAAAGAILVAEGLHQSVIRSALFQVASANIAGTAATPNSIFTIASTFIKSCPESNPPLPFKAFPSLQMAGDQKMTTAGQTAMLTVDPSVKLGDQTFVTFVSGLDTVSVPAEMAEGSVSAVIPPEAQGQTFVMLTNAKVSGSVSDGAVVAGPVVIEVSPPAAKLDFGLQR
ncbi:conserved hypothetical protein [Paecilomyces variotii No. 5]|uniref:Ferritin-like domain-containing protein n=1 Tax=Byssochlamys spectabilis (strain No. 5 / NBRC 109023) TaxID=1356009 RepID=V5GB07_BYSSN|nr:conserved hypothetical protein [Paecilomyces variotii No. 5]